MKKKKGPIITTYDDDLESWISFWKKILGIKSQNDD